MKMSWIRSSKSTAVLVLLLVAAAAVGTAAAVTTDATEAPEEAQVGDEVTVSVTLTDLYNESDNWTLNGTTELNNVTGWEVTKVQPNGNENTESFDGQTAFQTSIESADNLDSVRVTITGDVPAVEQYSYEPRQTFVGADLDRIVGENVNDVEEVTIHHYTNESDEARAAIEEAEEAVNASDSSEAQETLESAISAYDNGNFPNALNLAEEAQNDAESAQQSAQTTQMLLIGGGVLVLLLVIGGGFYYYRSQQDDYDKLR
jgi:hypothetical protein